MERKDKILILDSNSQKINALVDTLKGHYLTISTFTKEEAIKYIEEIEIDLIITSSTIEILNEKIIHSELLQNVHIPILLIVDENQKNMITGNLLIEYLFTPFTKKELLNRVEIIIKKFHEMKNLTVFYLAQTIEEIGDINTKALYNEIEKINLALKESEIKYKTLFTEAPEGVLIMDELTGRLIDINKAALDLFGKDKNEVFGYTHSDLFKNVDNPDKITESVLKNKNKTMSYNAFAIHKSGKEIPVSISTRIIIIDGSICQQVIVSDISEQVAVENKLREAKNKAEELNKLKTNLLQNVSHELRTPLIVIMGYTQILLDEIKDEFLLEMIQTINNSGNRLTDTIQLLIDYSVIEKREVTLYEKEIRPNVIVDELLSYFLPIAENKDLELDVNYLCKNYISIDHKMIKQALKNIINNSIKFTLKGKISIIIDNTVEDEKDYVRISVEDTGIGISQEKMDYIFEEFRQGSEGASRSYEGTGLGLTVTKKMVEMNRGKIKIFSELNKGTRVELLFPSYNSDLEIKQLEKIFNDRRKIEKETVLYYENNYHAGNIVNRMLDGIVNIELVSVKENLFEILKMSLHEKVIINLSLIDVAESIGLVRSIREKKSNYSFKIICIINSQETYHRELLIHNGASFVLSKPINKQELINCFM